MRHVTPIHVYATAIAAALLAPPSHAQAQTYPTRPVRMVIPFSPGGATDVPGRVLAQKLSEQFGQQVVVDNRPGAGSVVGTELVANAPADGYTILMTGTPFAVSPAIYRKLPYHPVKDFAPVGQFGSAPNTLVVHPLLGVRTTQELITLAKSQPGTASHRLFANGFLLDAANVAWFFDHYIDFHHRRDWRFAPLQADDLDGVAPACIILAECDPLVDEGLAYADRLRLAGVPVALELARGLTHDFIKMGRALKEAGVAQAAVAAALADAWRL